MAKKYVIVPRERPIQAGKTMFAEHELADAVAQLRAIKARPNIAPPGTPGADVDYVLVCVDDETGASADLAVSEVADDEVKLAESGIE